MQNLKVYSIYNTQNSESVCEPQRLSSYEKQNITSGQVYT
jgi:hypothetical protein